MQAVLRLLPAMEMSSHHLEARLKALRMMAAAVAGNRASSRHGLE
jgi:hypothetical protein